MTGSRLSSVESLCLRDGRELCVRRWRGSGAGTVVVLHGLLDSSEGWSDLRDRVSCSGVMFDLPGFGRSDPPSRGSIAGYARDIAEGLKLLGVERFTLVGHSLGGAVATAVAELMADQVDTLVLFAPAGFGRIRLGEAASVPGVRTLVHAALPWALSSRLAVTAGYVTMVTNGRSPEREVIERVTTRGRALVDGTREGIRAVVDAGRSRDAFHRRRVRYDGPVVAVWGDRDRLVAPSHQHGLRTALPQARIHVWPGMGHHPIRERFDELVALITDANASARPQFLSAHRQAAARPPLADAA
jgi:pimeloyl-ACP methyl ester carboxylesterase